VGLRRKQTKRKEKGMERTARKRTCVKKKEQSKENKDKLTESRNELIGKAKIEIKEMERKKKVKKRE
jgi:hypothetical protein